MAFGVVWFLSYLAGLKEGANIVFGIDGRARGVWCCLLQLQ